MNKLSKILISTTALLAIGCGDDDDGDTKVDPDGAVTPMADAAPTGPPSMPALGTQIDRTGRPAITTALVQTFASDTDAKNMERDMYNAALPATWSTYQDTLEGSLAILDGLDRDCGNQLLFDDENAAGPYAGLAGVLMDDQLYVNSDSGECGTYLGLEAEVTGVLGAGAGGCGGRTLTDDIIERSYSLLSGVGVVGVDDGIAEDGDCTQSNTVFPFVCAPLAP